MRGDPRRVLCGVVCAHQKAAHLDGADRPLQRHAGDRGSFHLGGTAHRKPSSTPRRCRSTTAPDRSPRNTLDPRLYALTKIKPGESATARLKVLQTATFENPQITIPGNPPCFDAVSAYTKRAGALRGSGQMVISKPPGASLKPPAPSPSPL